MTISSLTSQRAATGQFLQPNKQLLLDLPQGIDSAQMNRTRERVLTELSTNRLGELETD